MSETTPEDHLIILCEFFVGNKAHTTSSSIRVQVNCSKASVKLHLSYTVSVCISGKYQVMVNEGFKVNPTN